MIDELVYPKWPAQILKKDPNLTRRPSSLPTFSILNSPPLFPALPPAPPLGVSGLGLGAAEAAVRRLRLRAGPVDQGCANKCSLSIIRLIGMVNLVQHSESPAEPKTILSN